MQRLLLIVVFLARCGSSTPDPVAIESLQAHAHPITGSPADYVPLLSAIGDAQIVLLGEATHGTHEFYAERARITRLLIEEKGFTALALEADFVDAARVDAWVRGKGTDTTVDEALGGFDRFPRWMWRNQEFAELVEWMRDWNAALPAGRVRVGVYGIDLYGDDEARQFLAANPPRNNPDERFAFEQNERVVKNAAEYHREARRGAVSTWNIRDKHMVQTLAAIHEHLVRQHGRSGIAVWAHNSHVGDARATDRSRYGEWNVGQLVREHWPARSTYIVGFTTDSGSVFAADDWDGRGEVKTLRPSIRGSHGAILHAVGPPAFLLILGEVDHELVTESRPQRAVGVIYRPMTEFASHYYSATLSEQFDAVVHIDVTRALAPLD